ncbi:siderophore ABC transporter substrate-binding protein [Providencia vermicola]|uniref:Siderophore ABC transporter substrate-binding protein n=2 Tax=Providencia TaxID=586 RepID=A0AAI9HX17_PROST|nr:MULTISPECIES: siderophore ABC transporter substrate-binding protein [Providencia]ELR5045934.1 siderophore ABC transporter substrate-binding protein [Providencia rettgeri]ELR5034219.1 siderophore ABC transporter substrate-binding protein [Providencia stuartii]ELR5142070.1 siderophore ABC transporter substrate-binding protein [Providencia stuartii]ELR5291590.1 siderophore ABC transporter substrate-binding protein [Providencia stuartii]ELX8377930.1 siderophore ABC transporter substrate-binding
MFVKSLTSGLVLLSALVLAGCDQSKENKETSAAAEKQTITIEHAQGKTDVPRHPEKVFVMNMETLDIMDALGAPVAGLPQTNVHLPKFLSKYSGQEYTNAGTLFEPAYETISNAQPDLILGGSRARDAYDKLSAVAPTISMDIDNKRFIDSLTERTTELGMLFGKEKEAEQLVGDFKAKIADIKTKTPNAGKAMVILVSGGKISAYGPGSRFGFIFDELGFEPAYVFGEDTGRHGNIVNAELLVKLNPDWLFVIDRDSAIGRTDAQPAAQVLDNALVRKTSAWDKQQVTYLDPTAVYIAGGIQTYSQLMDDVNNALEKSQTN